MSVKHEFLPPPEFLWNYERGAFVRADGHHYRDGEDFERDAKGTPVNVKRAEVVASTSDQRTVNNDDNTMRHNYRVLSDAEKAQMTAVKDKGQELLQTIRGCGTSRELSLAATKCEEAVMWAVKHITK